MAEECLPNAAHSIEARNGANLSHQPDAIPQHRRKPRREIMSNEQKVAIITGASQGIGAGLVKAYRDRGYRVVATSRSIKPTNDKDVVAVAGDIGDPKTAEAVV